MMNTPLSIFDAMKEGRPVSRQEAEAVIKILEDMLIEARDKGREGYIIRLEDSIERIKTYRKRRSIKPRSLQEIQRDLEAAQEMVMSYRINRRYETAAKWEHNRDEYNMEYTEAIKGNLYMPELKEVEGNVSERVPDGFQLCL